MAKMTLGAMRAMMQGAHKEPDGDETQAPGKKKKGLKRGLFGKAKPRGDGDGDEA